MIRRSFVCFLIISLAWPAMIPGSSAQTAAFMSRPYEVRADDGTVLRGWVFLPDGATEDLPTVLEYTPYIDSNGSSSENDPGDLAFLLDEGYAVALVSIRGTGKSGGCLQYGNQRDIEDAVLVVNDMAEQPWSNGKVGMMGHSYPGWTADMAASAAPEPLKAVVPMSGVIDLYRLIARRGAPLAALGPPFGTYVPAEVSVVTPGLPERVGCAGGMPADSVATAQLTVDGDRTGWFQERGLEDALTNTKVPMLRTNGLVGFLEGHMLQVEDLWSRLRPDRTHFILGQWIHAPGEVERVIPEWHDIVTAWFDHYLRGGPRTIEPGVVEYQDDENQWHTADRWPPKAKDEVVHLSGSSIVERGNEVEPADQSLQSVDGLDPGLYPEVGGVPLLIGGDEIDNPRLHVTACGGHQALYVSPPVEENVLLAGQFEAEVTVSSTLPGGNFSVFLWKTSGDGVCPDSGARGVARSVMDLTHWKEENQGRPFPVGEPTSFWLESQPFASPLEKGERLVLAFGGGAFELSADPLRPLLTIHEGTFRLPAVSGDLKFAK